MKRISNKNLYIISITLYLVLNILNTYLLTMGTFNRYITPFDYSFLGTFNAIIGNLAILLFVLIFSFIFVKRRRKRILVLVIATLFFNILLFSLTIYTKYYGTAFTISSLNSFKNPSAELGFSIALETAKELFVYYRIILFIPFLIQLVIFILYNKKEITSETTLLRGVKKPVIAIILLMILMVVNIGIFRTLSNKWPLNASRSTYASQNVGVYSYLSYELVGIDFSVNANDYFAKDENIYDTYDSINKNKTSYVNEIDGKTYSNILKIEDIGNINNDFYLDTKYQGLSNLNGIFENKNLVLVHLESFNYFLLEIKEIRDQLPFLTTLISESYTFDNFYANIGVGTSADAEFSVLTGLYPIGTSTLYWDYTDSYNESFKPTSLVQYFNDKDFDTLAIHGDNKTFYNRENVYEKMYEFDYFYNIDDFEKDGYTNDNYNHQNPWISDYALMDVLYEKQNEATNNYFMFPMTMMPHTPFLYDPYENTDTAIKYSDTFENNLSSLALKYLHYMKYYDEILRRMFIDPNTNQFRGNNNTVYLFYGDHGCGLNISDISTIMGRTLSKIEHRKILNQVFGFMYVPSANYNLNKAINEGEIKGSQALVRGEADLYRTVIELFNLPVKDDMYFGVNMFSKEPTFSIDNRVLDCIIDGNAFSMLDTNKTINDLVNSSIYDAVLKRKKLNDALIVNQYFYLINKR
ncbi:sulfatase-like hydrolase/transferase [Acholeplasma sp. OttesenSCG-928-E16]|nr:sulfatase-like hydrolase/transferase [Acholeplasma sp. OttesenSCG-928-E16]